MEINKMTMKIVPQNLVRRDKRGSQFLDWFRRDEKMMMDFEEMLEEVKKHYTYYLLHTRIVRS